MRSGETMINSLLQTGEGVNALPPTVKIVNCIVRCHRSAQIPAVSGESRISDWRGASSEHKRILFASQGVPPRDARAEIFCACVPSPLARKRRVLSQPEHAIAAEMKGIEHAVSAKPQAIYQSAQESNGDQEGAA